MADPRIICPHCETSYTLSRCGLSVPEHGRLLATTGCRLCNATFEIVIMPGAITRVIERPGWFGRVVRRQKSIERVEQAPPVVETFKPIETKSAKLSKR